MTEDFHREVSRYQARYAYLTDLLYKDEEMRRTNPGKVPRDVSIYLLNDIAHCKDWLRRQGQPLYPK
jgi:hypothetical protein